MTSSSSKKCNERTGRRTVPQILNRGFSIGGSDDLVRLNESGQLDRLLGVPASMRAIISSPLKHDGDGAEVSKYGESKANPFPIRQCLFVEPIRRSKAAQ